MPRSRWLRYALVLGIALGGFFDGILLHQILQWHHLLSLVPGMTDLRMQVLWDGYFHALMYALAIFGLWSLWREKAGETVMKGRPLLGALIAGFGIWHVLDSVLSHWLLGIHRIRVDSDAPLVWDLAWFFGFGLLPLAIGWALMRGSDGGGPALRRPTATLLLLALVSAGSGGWALRPPSDQPFTTVVFRGDRGSEFVETALADMEARLVWADPAMSVVVMDMPAAHRWRLFRHGALLVSGTGTPAGCFNWSTVQA